MTALHSTHQRTLGETAPVPDWPKSAVRIVFGLILAVDAAFKWRPGFHRDFLMMIKESGGVLAIVLLVLLVLAGLELLVTGALGHCPLYAKLGHVPRSLRRTI
jgi:Protein of unknown function (DUF2892)